MATSFWWRSSLISSCRRSSKAFFSVRNFSTESGVGGGGAFGSWGMVFIVVRFALAGKSRLDEGVVQGQQDQSDDHALDRKPDQQRDGRYQDEADEAAKNRVKVLRVMLRLLDAVNKSADSADQRQDEVD